MVYESGSGSVVFQATSTDGVDSSHKAEDRIAISVLDGSVGIQLAHITKSLTALGTRHDSIRLIELTSKRQLRQTISFLLS